MSAMIVGTSAFPTLDAMTIPGQALLMNLQIRILSHDDLGIFPVKVELQGLFGIFEDGHSVIASQ